MKTSDGRPVFPAPRTMLMRKPKHGQECTRCGLCCVATLCELGSQVFQRDRLAGPCPGLVQDEDHVYSCNVVRNPQQYVTKITPEMTLGGLRRAAHLLIGAGTGCDARFNGEPSNPEFDAAMKQYDLENAKLIKWARKLWGLE